MTSIASGRSLYHKNKVRRSLLPEFGKPNNLSIINDNQKSTRGEKSGNFSKTLAHRRINSQNVCIYIRIIFLFI